jgi:hypothetical protein
MVMAYSTTPWKVLVRWRASIAARAGNGGYQLFGSCFGPGRTLLTSCSSLAVSGMYTVGGYKLYAVALLGMSL